MGNHLTNPTHPLRAWLANAADSSVSKNLVPELPGELEEHQSRSTQHYPITDGMGFAKIVECKPIDDQEQQAGHNHE
jgi:hypothetical protein